LTCKLGVAVTVGWASSNYAYIVLFLMIVR